MNQILSTLRNGLDEVIRQKAEGKTYRLALRTLENRMRTVLPSETKAEDIREWNAFTALYKQLKAEETDHFEQLVSLFEEGNETVISAFSEHAEMQEDILETAAVLMDPWCGAEEAEIRRMSDLIEEFFLRCADPLTAEEAAEMLAENGRPPFLIIREHITELSESLRDTAEELLEQI